MEYWHNGTRSNSTHSILSKSNIVPKAYIEKTQSLYNRYYPLEISNTITYAEKSRYMEEWWKRAHDNILDLKITKEDLREAVRQVPVALRPGVKEFVRLCEERSIPVLVFSAGLSDIIAMILDAENLHTPHTHVIANKMTFDERGTAIDFPGPLIHTCNKNEAAVTDPRYAKDIAGRRNVILMGDSIGDLQMSSGLSHDVQLTIGFCNHDKEIWLEKYMELFDIVISDDSPIEFPGAILSAVQQANGVRVG
ncbi:hypothetical protein HDV00_005440 [Rhizophlyctis rosea]|nr:hypothetical protein HDV00_005440 [Rhizophlyctis rosea]